MWLVLVMHKYQLIITPFNGGNNDMFIYVYAYMNACVCLFVCCV